MPPIMVKIGTPLKGPTLVICYNRKRPTILGLDYSDTLFIGNAGDFAIDLCKVNIPPCEMFNNVLVMDCDVKDYVDQNKKLRAIFFDNLNNLLKPGGKLIMKCPSKPGTKLSQEVALHNFELKGTVTKRFKNQEDMLCHFVKR